MLETTLEVEAEVGVATVLVLRMVLVLTVPMAELEDLARKRVLVPSS